MSRWRVAIAFALGGAAAMAGNAAQAAPYPQAELRGYETPDESKIRELRDQEITQLRITLGRRLAANRRADLYLRLAEIYIEGYRAAYLLEGRVHEKRIEHGQKESFIDHAYSKPFLAAGIRACQDILKLRIPFDKMDEVYYFLGFYNLELGDHDQGVKYFDELTRRFPSSRFLAEAYKEMGDAAYGRGDFRRAQAYYERAIARGKSDALPRVYHKLAWSYYRTKQFGRAVDTMKLAISSAQSSGEKYLSLKEEALRDMAIFYTETGKVDEAIAYFHGVVDDNEFYPRVLEKLGRQYERNVEPAKATQVYESLLKTNKDSEAGFRVMVKLVDLDLRRGRYNEALARFKGMNLNPGGGQDTQVASQNLRAMIRRTATEHHEKFRKQADKRALAIAEVYYTTYLREFLAADDARKEFPEIQMYLAEVKRESGKSKEASELYRSVLESKDKRYAKEAGALWTASLSEAIRANNPSVAAGQTTSKAKPGEPSPLELEYVEAADRMQDALGDTNEGREAALKAAEVLAGYKKTQDDAVGRIQKLIDRSPRTPQAVTGARLWLQILGDHNSEEQREIVAKLRGNAELLAADAAAGGKLRAQMQEQDTKFRVGQIAQQEKNSDFAAAGRNYESFAADQGARELAEKAYANAVTSFLKAKDPDSVERVAQAWVKRYPRSPKAIELIRAAATQGLSQGQFESSAQMFERLGREAGDADSLETAGRIAEGSGDIARAQKLWKSYLELHRAHPRRFAVILALAKTEDAAHQDGEAVTHYRACLGGSVDLAPECGARLGDLYLRNQNPAEAKKYFRQVASQRGTASRKKKKPKAPSHAAAPSHDVMSVASGGAYVGYARFKLAEMMEQERRFAALSMPEAKLKAGIAERLAFLEPLSRAYTSAVEAGGPWAVAALDRLAAWAMGFAQDVDQIQPPAGFDAASVANFRKGLEGISAPLKRKATSTWTQGYQQALGGELLSPVLPALADHLADAGSQSPARAQGYRNRLRLAGVPADGGTEGGAVAMQRTRDRLLANAQDSGAWTDYGNLLWGENRPLLAKIAYERAVSLNSKNPAALNNRGVVVVLMEGEENWANAIEGSALIREALRQDEFFLAAKINRASILNYYRLFEKARPHWEQILTKYNQPDIQDGLAVSLQGLGRGPIADSVFKRSTDQGSPRKRFVNLYHEAARAQAKGDYDRCLSSLGDLEVSALAGFERSSAESLQRACSQQKGSS